MKRWLCVMLLACGGRAPHELLDAGPTKACLDARALRSDARDLEAKGEELLAKAKLDDANASCPTERASTAPLESTVHAALGVGAPASKGTEETARKTMHEAFAAEHAKDFARAQTLWLGAWAELHPNPIALEAAGRAAERAGRAAEGRRLRDRALFEAESTEHATAKLTNRVRATVGASRLVGGTLVVAENGRVVARDLATGELRALLDVDVEAETTVSPLATIAMTHRRVPYTAEDDVVVYDLLARKPLLGGKKFRDAFVSPDDKLLLVRARDGSARVIDVATGAERAKLESPAFAHLGVFAFDSRGHVLAWKWDDDRHPLEDWDVEKNAFGRLDLPARFVGVSENGRYLVALEGDESSDPPPEALPLEVRDLETGKTVARWTGRFFPVGGVAVTDDASLAMTKSYNSLRLWNVSTRRQTFIAKREDGGLDSYAFSDDGKTVVLGRDASTTLWDTATGKETPAVSDQRHHDVLGATQLPDGGVAFVLDDEVRVVPRDGDMRVLCKGIRQAYFPDVGPTSVVVSPSGRSLACAMSGGAIHVFDTASWQERSRIDGPAPGKTKVNGVRTVWDGAPPSVRPIDLAFSADDAKLTAVSDDAIVTFDASTGAKISNVKLRDPKLLLARRHARLADGRVVVKTSTGAGAIFDASGGRAGDLALVAGAPVGSPDAFSANGKAYAIAVGKVLHLVDLGGGADRTTSLPDEVASVALSADGASCALVLRDGTAYRAGSALTKLDAAPRARRAFFLGTALVVVAGDGDTLDLFGADGAPHELEVDPNGVIARSSHGAFEVRGRAEAECVVGRYDLTEQTCAGRAEPGLIHAWMQAAGAR